MRKFTFIISALVLGFASFANAQDLRLKDSFEINGPNVTIGDLFDNAGDGAGRILASAPKSGQKLAFSTIALASRVNNMGFNWKAPKDLKTIYIVGDGPNEIVSNANYSKDQIITEIAVLNRNVGKDETISFDMIEFIKAPNNLPHDIISDAEILIGSRAKTALNANTPIKSYQIGPALMVKRGQNILLVHEIGGLKITMQAKALEDGFKGTKIKAVNTQTNKIIEAMMGADGTARVIGLVNSKSANLQ